MKQFLALLAFCLVSIITLADNPLLSYTLNNISQGTITVAKDNDNNYTVTAVPASGYVFYKWTDTNSTNPVRVVCCLTSDQTYTAQFVRQFAVTFRATADSVAYVLQGCQISAMPKRSPASGYVFVGWATTENAITPDITFPYTPTDDITLFPVWQVLGVHVTTTTTTGALPISVLGAPSVDLYVDSNVVLTVTETTPATQLSLKSITLEAGARLVIPTGTYLSAAKLVINGGAVDQSDNYKFIYAKLVVNGTLNVSGNVIYYDYLLNKKQQYPLCLPGNVNVADITYSDGSLATLGEHYKIAEYSGTRRATGNSGWQYIANNTTTLTAGKGYTIFANPLYYQYGGTGTILQYSYSRLRFPIPITANYTEAVKTVSVSPYPSSTGKDNDAGWNLVGNPYFADFSQDALGLSYQAGDGISLLTINSSAQFVWTGNQRYVVIAADNGKAYYSELASTADLPAFKPFFVQIGANDASALSFPIANRKQNMLSKNVEEEDVLMTGIMLYSTSNTADCDRLGVLLGDDYTDVYEINADLQKFGHNSGVNLYAWMRSSELAFVAVNESYAANAIPVGFIAPKAAEYKFTLDSRYNNTDFEHIYLYDNQTKITTDLLFGDYSFTASAGINNARFALTINTKASSPTAIESVANTSSDVKVYDLLGRPVSEDCLLQGQFYIKENKKYIK